MARSRIASHTRRSGQRSPHVMGEMFQKTPEWVWLAVLAVLVLLWIFLD
ncbi:hypothetical protein [Runella slithyformis]|uniref:Uncharacterized protein n=1 Tax=Runella slithyformis (strain ATCC 29530 / DSM 19594 / LMG 11500 / NCIMB 11436 / LSU 4) TaxID=761193 RepID=A0A7U3ZP52_RUNSL|nr:hypothetical protein [Runella slithyformis]AEI50802.1 hypothetical protein Runsl_4479 [Runella slithyformis DSM 19594]